MAYIRDLEDQCRSYHIQEFCCPERCAPDYEHNNPTEREAAHNLWEGWMEQCWLDVAAAHLGRKLTEADLIARYGTWKDRHNEPGASLLRLINKDQPSIVENLERIAVRSRICGF